ncbi:hypothetical protein ACFXBB_14430 [Streptomyces scopuliridis]|uniref:hypothetical protein n=1 Tax=Streptomyces scopuliridis TaxID=452529 RepID=UPI00369E6C5E
MDVERERDAMWNPDKVRIETDQLVRLMNDRCDVLNWRLTRIEAVPHTPRISTPQVFTDRLGATDPFLRAGWATVRQQIRSGFVDGVVALTHRTISPRLDKYELPLGLVEDHGRSVSLVTPETVVSSQLVTEHEAERPPGQIDAAFRQCRRTRKGRRPAASPPPRRRSPHRGHRQQPNSGPDAPGRPR